MRKAKILAIAPYEGMQAIMQDIASRRTDFQLTAYTGDLEDGVSVLSRVDVQNYDVIVSRGSTADMIRKKSPIPVIEVQTSPFDIIRAIKLANALEDRLVIVGYQNLINTAKPLCELLNYDVEFHIVADYDSALNTMHELRERKIHLILCDMISQTVANEIGLNAILITSGVESIESTFDEAVRYTVNSLEYQFRTQLLRDAMISKGEYLLVYDGSELVFSTFENRARESEVISALHDAIQTTLSGQTNPCSQRLGEDVVFLQSQKLKHSKTNYTLLSLKFCSNYPHNPCRYFTILHTHNISLTAYRDFFTPAEYANLLQNRIKKYASGADPVLIVGESGCGTFQIAQMLFKESSYTNEPMYVIDCDLLAKRQFDRLFTSADSPLFKRRCVLFLNGLECLAQPQIRTLFAFFSNYASSDGRKLIISANYEYQSSECSRFIDHLLTYFPCQILSIPPLRQRPDSIPGLSSWYINQLNIKFGRQISGIEPDALEMLQKYNWPGNVVQLHQAISELVANTAFPISAIRAEETAGLLRRFGASYGSNNHSAAAMGIDLNKTMSEIEYEVIRLILSEPGMTQSKASDRLKISRSTLWRILKNNGQ